MCCSVLVVGWRDFAAFSFLQAVIETQPNAAHSPVVWILGSRLLIAIVAAILLAYLLSRVSARKLEGLALRVQAFISRERQFTHSHHRIGARYQRQDGGFVHIKKNQQTPLEVQAI